MIRSWQMLAAILAGCILDHYFQAGREGLVYLALLALIPWDKLARLSAPAIEELDSWLEERRLRKLEKRLYEETCSRSRGMGE